MIEKIVSYLNENYDSYKFVRYGDADLPACDYGVIRTEKLPTGRGIRVILHKNKGYANDLESNLRDVVVLLENKMFTDDNGKSNKLGRMIDYTDVTPLSDDGTISMEALFLMPTTTF